MARILLIEPDGIIKQAIRLFLFPDHDVEVRNGFDKLDIGRLGDWDLLIVDASSLRQLGKLTPEMSRALQRCKIPTIWLEETETSQTVRREKSVLVKKPIERKALESALGALLSPRTPERVGSSAGTGGVKGDPRRRRQGRGQRAESQLIDLVEVVEDQSGPKRPGKATADPK